MKVVKVFPTHNLKSSTTTVLFVTSNLSIMMKTIFLNSSKGYHFSNTSLFQRVHFQITESKLCEKICFYWLQASNNFHSAYYVICEVNNHFNEGNEVMRCNLEASCSSLKVQWRMSEVFMQTRCMWPRKGLKH